MPTKTCPSVLIEEGENSMSETKMSLLILEEPWEQLCLIPQISSLAWFTTVVPLVLVLAVSGVKDAIDDFVRFVLLSCTLDFAHHSSAQSLKLKDEKWMNIQVGDIIKLENNNFVTADLLLLSSSEPHRPDTKLMQNSGRTTFKRTSIDRLMNVLVLMIFAFLALMCLILAIGNGIWESDKGYNFQVYLPWAEDVTSAPFSAFLMFWSYVIILNTVVPISLYVSVEIIRLGNSFYIDWDRKMYYPLNDTPAQARTTTLNEELGQIKYIFSDKTGTLTQNIMCFNKCSINGKSYGMLPIALILWVSRLSLIATNKRTNKNNSISLVQKQGGSHTTFFSCMAGNLVYQAQSPDEGALVTAARNFGFVFRARTPETITVVEMGETKIYKLLAILDFNNVRKRMSVIVRSPEGDLTLYCKGADTILYELLHPSCESLKEETTEHLNEFAGEGLRTLVVAYKNLDEEYFQDWIKRHHEASTALEGREDKLSEIYEEIEKDLMLLGATAIEDKLQDGVPQTIETLAKASIKIWVLTGDKQETAMNIGYSCNLLYDDMADVFVIEGSTSEDVLNELRNARKKMKPDSFLDSDEINIQTEKSSKTPKVLPDEQANGVYGLVINGHSLAYALEGNLELELVRTACMCKVVICCRVTPLQKVQVLITPNIQPDVTNNLFVAAAHIGVGISGQEGMQAVLSSDFSFAQFRYLQRLLLVHGRWSYIRMCKFLKYFFYKNFAFTLVHFWYGFFSGFSAQTVYDQWFITLYNLMYTSLPVLGMSLFDQDVDDRWSLLFPQLYVPGQQNLYFNKTVFIKCMLQGIYSSLILFFIPYGAMYNTMRSDGKAIADYQSFALMAQTCLLIVVSVQIGLDTSYWTVVNQFFIWGSLSVYFAITFTMYSDGMYLILTASFPFVGKQLSKPVLLKIKEAKKRPPPPSPKRRLRRTSTRRSGYAFSHQHGFGALIMSGRNMRPKSPFATTGTFSPNSEKYKHKGL
uniref:Phospholipid-transporting ATPase n=1 Tax=Pavo cristatus TaxID=9049 RepID=A0A8C9F4R7_PAVCR